MVDRKLSELPEVTGGPLGTDEFYFIRHNGDSPPTYTSYRGMLSEIASVIGDVIASEVGFSPTGLDHTTATDVQGAIEDLDAAISAAAGGTDFIAGIIASPSDKDYRLALNLPYALTIVKTTTRSASGTCTATFKINTTAVGGTANSVSSSEQAQTHASSNSASVGDDIVMTVSSNSSCADLSFLIEFTR